MDPGAPDPTPPASADPDDEIFLLGERIADLAVRINAAEHEMLTLIARFDERRGWAQAGFASCADWLAWRTGIKIGPAREKVRTALALRRLPQTSAAMKSGELSFTKVRALTRVATAASEADLLAFAHAGSAANLERLVRAWKHLDRAGELTVERLRHRSRTFSVFVDDDGMYVVKGRLEPEVGAVLMRAVEAAGDVLFSAEDAAEVEPEQRRADAVGLVAERVLAAGFGEGPLSGSRAERYQVVLHVEAATLRENGEPGRSELDGVRVSAETSRRMTCDAGLVTMTDGKNGGPLDVGRRPRTVPPPIRRALEARDRGCRFPGCGSRFTDAHHVKHWADGGETALRNLVLLCRRHHRLVHQGGARLCTDRDGKAVFFSPGGRALSDAPAPPTQGPAPLREPPAGESGGSAQQRHTAATSGSAWKGASRWRRDREVPWEIEARAREALEAVE